MLVAAYGCGSCHIIPDVNGADGVVGPPLSDWAARQWIAGNLRNEPANLTAWLENPQVIEPGTAMPAQGVTPQEARHIAAFLYTLRPSELGPPHLLPLRWLETLGYEPKPAPTAATQASGR